MNIDYILQTYKPIIYFHKDELYFPCDANYFVNNSYLIHNNKIIDHDFNQFKLYNQNENNDTFIQPKHDFIKYGYNYNFQDAPLYYFIRENNTHIYIYFFLFFAYNGSYNILNLLNIGEHYSDIEHFTYEINKKTNKLERIFFSAHGSNEGIWKNIDEIEYDVDNNRPIIYSAKFGHGFYPKSGCFVRIFGFPNDITNKGYKLHDYNYIKISKKNDIDFNPYKYGWFYSNIRLGIDGTKQIYKRNYLIHEDNGVKFQKIIPENIYDITNNIVYLILIIILFKLFEYYLQLKYNTKKILFISFIFILVIIITKFIKENIKKYV